MNESVEDESKKFLDLLRVIPDDVVLSLGTRNIKLDDPQDCFCGWTAKELRVLEQDVDAEELALDGQSILEKLTDKLGETWQDWQYINSAFTTDVLSQALELAFVDRVL